MKAIIFDMDGVLIDSTLYVAKAFNELLKPFGVVLDLEYEKKTLGMSLRDQITMWRKDFNIGEEIDFSEFSKKAFFIEKELMKGKLKPNKKILGLIENAKKSDFQLAVATSSMKARAEEILDLIDVRNKLDSIVTAEDVERHKPDPQLFLTAAEKLSVNPENCVVFEDALNGIEAAKNAGMKVVGVLTPYADREEFERKADLVIKDFSEIDVEKLNKLVEPI